MALYSLREMKIGGTGGSDEDLPWDLSVSQSGGITSVGIRPGSINNIVPSNMFQTILASGSSGSPLYVKLACSTDGRVITDVLIYINNNQAAAQGPTNSALPSYFEYTVGVISGGLGYNIARKLLTATGSRLFLTSPNSPAGPGEMAFEEFLVWSLV
jgi:hypothetical protein